MVSLTRPPKDVKSKLLRVMVVVGVSTVKRVPETSPKEVLNVLLPQEPSPAGSLSVM